MQSQYVANVHFEKWDEDEEKKCRLHGFAQQPTAHSTLTEGLGI